MSDANRNQLWGRVLIDELVRSGVEHAVVAPGSRSTPLALAAHADPVLEVHVCLDERSAAFFALGIGRASGSPAVVITTSGTAVANLLPAAVEADRANVPLLLLTADRPRELRDADANQSVAQPGIFSTCARAEWDLMHPDVSDASVRHLRAVACRAVAAARGPGGGPVHINVPLRKPLEPTPVESDRAAIAALDPAVLSGRPGRDDWRGPPWTGGMRDAGVRRETAEAILRSLTRAKRPLIVAGHIDLGRLWHEGPSQLLAALAFLPAPILVDPLSGMRSCAGHGTARVSSYDLLLRDDVVADALRPDFVLQLGRSPTSKVLQDWLADCPNRIVVGAGPLWKDHTAAAAAVFDADPDALVRMLHEAHAARAEPPTWAAEPGWVERWTAVEAAAREQLAGHLDSEELQVARAVLANTSEDAALFISSSMPIRDADTVWGCGEREVRPFANRGASGIDGIVSSALGAAVGLPRRVRPPEEPPRRRGVCLLGDLALLHDANGMALAAEADVVFVVVNNDGGGIFGMLPIAEWDPPFTELFATPHGRDLSKHSAAFGLPHEVVDASGVGAAISAALAAGGTRVVEVRTDRRREVEARSADRARALAAARSALSET